ncbi:ClpXP protease specificity-enhancing factor [Ottowia sp. GY511]|uniref:ClpXP protease specificity-enhancing factor n=1 Tax=Ottowia flava TaxID=2675430 RepID=A0ABW4KXD6_9BURK|nr:ClpXP protease specificity-enhancing factor [Ottowia sp. GY511]TXK31249.1 ClpXP protease specificity-enhancing factor [Ottowia sp. GY511]
MNALESTSTRPYLIRALYEWCSDNGLTPYIAVRADDGVQVPREYVQNGEIVLNISPDATSGLTIGNEFIDFKARFGGVPREIMVPIDRVLAIYARENGQGMAFPVTAAGLSEAEGDDVPQDQAETAGASAPAARSGIQLVSETTTDSDDNDPPPPKRKKPALKRIK